MTGVVEKELSDKSFWVYPNPFSDYITIGYTFNKPSTIKVSILDLLYLVMRLNKKQREIIERTAKRHFGKDVRVYLFGSRIYPEQKGGDIDLFLEMVPEEQMTIKKKIALIVDLKKNLGDQKIDVVFKTTKTSPSEFLQIVGKTKIPI